MINERIDGVYVENSTRKQGLIGSMPTSTVAYAVAISLNVGDELEIMVASELPRPKGLWLPASSSQHRLNLTVLNDVLLGLHRRRFPRLPRY